MRDGVKWHYLLFFDRSGPTKEIWFYEHPIPEGRKNYTKTKPLQYQEFAPFLEWWNEREENERAWRVSVEEVLKYDEKRNLISVNLDIKNPDGGDKLVHLPPEELVKSILEKEERIIEIMDDIKWALGETAR